MEIVLIVLLIALVFAISVAIKKTRDANEILDNQVKLERIVKDQARYIEDIKEIVKGHAQYTDKDFIKHLKAFLGVE